MLLPKRKWKDIEGYEGLYQVSNTGKVRSLNYNKTGQKKILKLGIEKRGYKHVTLYKNNKRKIFKVHRLVAQAFISNPNNYPCVNHKDENPSNNHVSNLEFCTVAYNNSYGTRLERMSAKNKGRKLSKEHKQKLSEAQIGKYAGAKNPAARKVMCLNNGMIFDTVKEAANWSSSSRSSIAKQIKGKQKTAGKDPVTGERLQWEYLENIIY